MSSIKALDMFHLLYVSNCDRYLNPKVVAGILERSRSNNAKLGITGMLLHLDGAFLQVLEGDKQRVLDLYTKIITDPRHWKASILLMREAPAIFTDWSMGFHRLTQAEADEYGAFSISKAALSGKLDPSQGREVMALLTTFYKIQTNDEIPQAS